MDIGPIQREGVTHRTVPGLPLPPLAADATGLTVYWWGDVPIGHRFALGCPYRGPDRSIAPEAFERLASTQAARPTLDATVVICTRDRPDELARCLASLPQQSYPPREIIVVDNASRDGRTRDVALAAGVTYVREDRPGLDYARNAGATRATGEVVAYTDDDVVLHPRWLERMVAALDAPEIGAVTGLVLPAELVSDAQYYFESFWSFGQGYDRRDFDAAAFAAYEGKVFPAWEVGAGASMAFRRSIFDKVGLFDERLDVGRAGCSGDSEYWYRILAAGFTCRYEPASVAFHYHRRTLDGLSGQLRAYMCGHVTSLLVQHERTGIAANRARALWLPRWYVGRAFARLRGHRDPRDKFLKQELHGTLVGFLFYYRTRKERRHAR